MKLTGNRQIQSFENRALRGRIDDESLLWTDPG